MLIYRIFIQPIEYLIEVIFVIFHRFFGHPGYAIIGVSLAVSFLTLPLYLRADEIQEEERKQREEMKKWSEHIHRTFKRDERSMMISTYYKEKGYHPLYALRGTLSLLLQVPFFFAAYRFLSSLQVLQGCNFWFIEDLGVEDAALHIVGLEINLLPILMTVINMISSFFYTRGHSWKERIQPFVLALLFLILLYHSPSGLVFYWTLNNLFSLIKNLVSEYVKDKKRFIRILILAMDLLYLVYLFGSGQFTAIKERGDNEALLCLLLLGILPVVFLVFSSFYKKKKRDDTGKNILIPQIALTVLIGLMIPMAVISSDPLGFVDSINYYNPIGYIWNTLCVSLGLFIVWGGVIGYLLGRESIAGYRLVLTVIYLEAMINYLFFKADVGVLTMTLQFEKLPYFDKGKKVLILLSMIMIIILCITSYWFKFEKLIQNGILVLIAAMLVITGTDMVKTIKIIREYENTGNAEENVQIRLSRTGKNVVVIMLDRAIGGLVPFCFDEKPEMYELYKGFTFYPNTVSTGLYTNYGAPALFGGYDYTTRAMNERKDELLSQKHNEALKVMPVLFGEAGYWVGVADPPYAGYQEIPDLSIYNDYPYIHAFHYESLFQEASTPEEKIRMTERNLFFYSLCRCSAGTMQYRIYDGGGYLSAEPGGFTAIESDKQCYGALKSLSEITTITEDGKGFFMMDNNLPHSPYLLFQLPDYTLPHKIDNTGYEYLLSSRTLNGVTMDLERQPYNIYTYHCNMAALLRLGDWFEYLRKEGIFDNTRIIIAADHGKCLGMFSYMQLENGLDVEGVNALLMVKDFDSNAPFTIDDTFMTNADVPGLAVQGVINDPINPFTGNKIDMSEKEGGVDIIWAMDSDILTNNGYVFQPEEGPWYHVHDNIYDVDNWTQVK